MKPELTRRERQAIDRLRKAFDKFPDTLWIYVAGGAINIMKTENGKQVMDELGSFDQDYCVDEITGVLADGGDW